MLKNAPTLAIVAVHTAENGPPKVLVQSLTELIASPTTEREDVLLQRMRIC